MPGEKILLLSLKKMCFFPWGMALGSPGIDAAARGDGWCQLMEQSGSAEQKPAGTKREHPC